MHDHRVSGTTDKSPTEIPSDMGRTAELANLCSSTPKTEGPKFGVGDKVILKVPVKIREQLTWRQRIRAAFREDTPDDFVWSGGIRNRHIFNVKVEILSIEDEGCNNMKVVFKIPRPSIPAGAYVTGLGLSSGVNWEGGNSESTRSPEYVKGNQTTTGDNTYYTYVKRENLSKLMQKSD